jgi:hypothetical protein
MATYGVVLVVSVVLAACSGSNGKKLATPSSSTTPVATGPTTTIRPVDTSFTGQNSAQFCALAKTYNDRFGNVGTASTPAQLRTVTQDGRTAINQAAAAAPSEIKPDVQVLADAFGTLFTELDKVNFDPTKVSAAAFAPLQTPQFQTSTVRFQAYLKSVCGVS